MTLKGKMKTKNVANFDKKKKDVLFFSNASDEGFAFARLFTG